MNSGIVTTTIGSVFDIMAGKALSQATRHGPTQVPFLRTANVLWGRLDLSNVDHMAYSAEDFRLRTLQAGDLLVCEGGEIGRAAIWSGAIPLCGFQNHVHRLRPRLEWSKRVHPEFVMYYLQAGFTKLGLFEGAGNKTTIPNLSRNKLAALPLQLPTLDEQQRISALLTVNQEAIAIQRQTIVQLEELFEALLLASIQPLALHGTVLSTVADDT